MSAVMVGPAQAFMATSQHGRREPLIVAVYDKEKGEETPVAPVPEHAISTLEQVMRTTGYPDFMSFLVMEPYMEFMDARAQHVMDAFFDREHHILLIRCDSRTSAQAFIGSVRKHFQLQPIAKARAAAASRATSLARP